MKIAFIQTGGTIDKDYPRETGGYAFEIDTPAFERILNKLNPGFDFRIYSAFKKDSLDISDEDRDYLVDFVGKLDERRIVVTHGTDTLIETAVALQSVKNKTIVVTGAKLPERFSNSDAPVNLGAAVGAVQVLKDGSYVCMQGLVAPAEQVTRDMKSGTFQMKGS